ncbi:SDR family oxidoreductase [Morganella morganii]|uniref:SDR family oxidoreductase n=1 Tax=Morganella morganii TaxID=582 RepID=UPI0023684921|nr:SDR family oxidoreductase [Morganella morganii]
MTKKNNTSISRVLVIGGTSEIGKEVISSLARDDYLIDFTYFTNTNCKDEISAEIKFTNSFKVNLTDLDAVTDFLNEITDINYDTVIYCPGENPCKLCHDLSPDDITRITNLNFVSPTLIFTHLSKKMVESKEKDNMLIYLSSISSDKASIGDSVYGATKIATERYLASLSLELARFNVRTLCISPGFVDTKMMHDCREVSGTSYNDILRSIPARKMLHTSDVAKVTAFFIKNKNITTGNTIIIGNGEKVF